MSDKEYPVFPSGHTAVTLDAEIIQRIQGKFPYYGSCLRLWPGGWFFEEQGPDVVAEVQKFEFQDGDIVVVSFPKSGVTWTQEIVWTLVHNPNLNNPKASAESIGERSPHLDGDLYFAKKATQMPEVVELFSELKERFKGKDVTRHFLLEHAKGYPGPQRVLKSHFPISLLPKDMVEKTKVIYTARDPRDVIVSRFSWNRTLALQSFSGDFDEFLDMFVNEEMYYNPYWKHLEEAWNLRNHPNFLFVKYEDLKADPMSEYEQICKHLNINLTKEKLEKIVDYTSFESMKKRTADGETEMPMTGGGRLLNQNVLAKTGGFFRKGEAGDWKANFNDCQMKKLLKWIRDNTEGFPDDFPYLVKDD